MNNYLKVLMASVLIVFLVSCKMGNIRPDWVDGQDAQYSQTQYLSATGSASKEEDAKGRALANLAKVFEVQIEDASSDISQANISSKNGVSQQENSTTVVRYINTYSTKLLEGAYVAEQWHDEKTRQHYALALMSRAQVATRLRQDLQRVDRQTELMLRAAAQQPNALKSAASLARARQSQYSRREIQRMLQVVDRTGAGIKSRYSLEQIDNQLNKQLSKITVTPQVIRDEVGGVGRGLQAGLDAAGVTMKDPADYQAQATLDLKGLEKLEDWYWYRGAIEVNLIETASGRVKGSKRWPLKVSAQTESQAKTRLKDLLLKTLTKEMRQAFIEFGSVE